MKQIRIILLAMILTLTCLGTVFSEPANLPIQTTYATQSDGYFVKLRVFSADQEQVFQNLVGANYEKFQATAQICSQTRDLDGYGTRVYEFNVRGLFTIMESIIMVRDSDNTIWAAVIDGDKVLYFTNAQNTRVPKTILHWQDRFRNKPICLE